MYKKYMLVQLVTIFSITCLLFACASAKFRIEPDNTQNGLAIGRIVLDVSGFIDPPFPMNSTYGKLTGVEFTFENSHGVEITVKSRNGYFFVNETVDSDYLFMKKLYYERTFSNGKYNYKTVLVDGSEKIYLKPGTVNNLGTIEWVVQRGDSESWDILNTGHEEVESWFRSAFPASGWLDARWKALRLVKSSSGLRWGWHIESR